jgi:hypothetical protein
MKATTKTTPEKRIGTRYNTFYNECKNKRAVQDYFSIIIVQMFKIPAV